MRMVFVLSVIAQLLRNNPKFYYPFTRKFLLTVFSIDAELLEHSPIRDQILAVVAVIYENLARQPKLITKYSLQTSLKEVVLGNYRLVQEVSTLKIMNKAVSHLANKGITISLADFHKYQLMQTVSRIIARSQRDLLMVKMRLSMLSPMPSQQRYPLCPIAIVPQCEKL